MSNIDARKLALDASIIEREIATLIEAYPELAEDETLRADMLEGATNIKDVLAAVVDTMQSAKSMRDAIKARTKELSERAARFDRREEAMRVLAERIMRVADLRKVELFDATLSIRATPQAVVITAEEDLPDSFWRVTKSPDKTAIKEALKAGQFVPGACLSNAGETISVRVA